MIGSVISPPQTYADWAAVLDLLKSRTDDDAVLDAMYRGQLEWQAGVSERFAKKLTEAVNSRMNSASDRFQRDMLRANGQERVIVQALLGLRKEMSFLAKAISLPVIPEKDREQYRQLVIDQANSMQKSLEDSARKDRTGRLASLVRNNKVNAI